MHLRQLVLIEKINWYFTKEYQISTDFNIIEYVLESVETVGDRCNQVE